MSFTSGVGVGIDEDAKVAVQNAAAVAADQCRKPVLVLAFVTHSYPAEDLNAVAQILAEMFPGVPTAGGQVNGITFGDQRYDAVFANRRAIAVVAMGGDGIRGAIHLEENVTRAPRQAGRALAQRVIQSLGGQPAGGLFFGVGLSNVPPFDQEVLNGIRDVAPRLRMTGCGLCGGMKIDGSYDPGVAFSGRRLAPKGILLAALGGNLNLGFSASNGMKAVGPGAFITKVDGPEILELNGKPAKDVVLDLLAGNSAELRSLFEKNPQVMGVERGTTLGVADPEGDFYWCHFPAAFTQRGGVYDAFGPRPGMGLAVTRIDSNSSIDAVVDAARMLAEDAAAREFGFSLSFSCSLRGFTLGADRAREDVELRNHLKTRQHLGIVANGEIACYRHGRPMFTGWAFTLFGVGAGQG